MEQVQKALEMAATELNGLYKRLGYKDSSVLSLIYEALDEVKKCNIHDVSGMLPSKDEAVSEGFKRATVDGFNFRLVCRNNDSDAYYSGWMDCYDWISGNYR